MLDCAADDSFFLFDNDGSYHENDASCKRSLFSLEDATTCNMNSPGTIIKRHKKTSTRTKLTAFPLSKNEKCDTKEHE
jgi:hypothetical protein